MFLLEDCLKSQTPVKMKMPHFPVFPEFREASYVQRYQILLTKLLRERLYDGTSLILSTEAGGKKGEFSCPSEELSFRAFAAGLSAHAATYARLRS